MEGDENRENRKSSPRLFPNFAPPRTPASLRAQLEIDPTDSPLLLLAGDGYSARIRLRPLGRHHPLPTLPQHPRHPPAKTPPPRSKEDLRTAGRGTTRLCHFLEQRSPTTASSPSHPPPPPEPDLLAIADIMLLTPDIATPTRPPPLHALAASVPITSPPPSPASPKSSTTTSTASLSATPTPLAPIAAKLEEFMNDPTLRQTITRSTPALQTTTQPTANSIHRSPHRPLRTHPRSRQQLHDRPIGPIQLSKMQNSINVPAKQRKKKAARRGDSHRTASGKFKKCSGNAELFAEHAGSARAPRASRDPSSR